jgi:hypothetical protein
VWGQGITLDTSPGGVALDTNPQRIELDTRRVDPSKIQLQFRIPNTPTAILSAAIYDHRSRKINFRMLLDEERGIILGTHLPDVQIELIHDPAAGTYTLVGRRNGIAFALDEDDVYVTDLSYNTQCFSLDEPNQTDIPLFIGVAIDVSGSMFPYLDDVRQSFTNFIQSVPKGSMCQVVAFDSDAFTIEPRSNSTLPGHRGYQACADFEDMDAEVTIRTRGRSTALIASLNPFYTDFLTKSEASNMLLVLSDGHGDTRRRRVVRDFLRLREDAVEEAGVYTVVNWLGDYNSRAPISAVADHTFVGTQGGNAGRKFFQKSMQFINAQRILSLQNCN